MDYTHPEADYSADVLDPEEDDAQREALEDRVEDGVTDTESQQTVEVKTLTKRKTGLSAKAANQAADINDKLYKMELELENSKEKYYREYMSEVEAEMKGIQDGTSPEYEERLQELIEEREITIHKANLLREYQLEMSEKIFEEEVAQAEEDYERERQELIDKLLADIEERRKKLQEERNNSDLMHDVVLETSTRQTSRKLRERQGIKEAEPKPKRPKTMPIGPTPMFRLSEAEILADWAELAEDVGSAPKKSISSAYKKKSA